MKRRLRSGRSVCEERLSARVSAACRKPTTGDWPAQGLLASSPLSSLSHSLSGSAAQRSQAAHRVKRSGMQEILSSLGRRSTT